jgi:hypothetical protein
MRYFYYELLEWIRFILVMTPIVLGMFMVGAWFCGYLPDTPRWMADWHLVVGVILMIAPWPFLIARSYR